MNMKIRIAENTEVVDRTNVYKAGQEVEVEAGLGAALIRGGSAELVVEHQDEKNIG